MNYKDGFIQLNWDVVLLDAALLVPPMAVSLLYGESAL